MVIRQIKERFSCREFLDKPVEKHLLETILEAGRVSPSAKNLQNWKFITIKDENLRKQLGTICRGQTFVSAAPVTIAVCCTNLNYQMTCGIEAYIADGFIAAQNMVTQAVEFGLGSCYIGAFFQQRAKKLLQLPEDWKIVTLLPMGYPKQKKRDRFVKSRSDVFSIDSF